MIDQLNDWIAKNFRHCDGGSGGQVRCMRTGFEIFMQDIFIQPAGHTFATKQRQISLDIKCTGLLCTTTKYSEKLLINLRLQGEGGHCPKI